MVWWTCQMPKFCAYYKKKKKKDELWNKHIETGLKQSPSFIYNILNCNAKLLLISSGHLFNKENKH